MAKRDILPNAAQSSGGPPGVPSLFGPGSAYPFRIPPATQQEGGELEFKIGHVLFIDIVGYSNLLLHEQGERLRELNEIVRGTNQFRRAEMENSLVRLPTGDGMALVFRRSPEAPPQCALEISEAARAQPQMKLRMGIHSGPVSDVSDVNERANIAGAGINIAQRVMDCGDAGHILLSKHVAEDLEHSVRWRPHLHELGEFEVKHGVAISIVNLFTNGAGNAATPSKLARVSGANARRNKIRHFARFAIPALLITGALLGTFLLVSRRTGGFRSAASQVAPTEAVPIPEKSIAVLPFENLSANQETAFFTDGVQDEILTDLAKVADLKVISRTSVTKYRDLTTRNLREIAQQLGVAHVLEGSVQRAENRIRVNAQLIDAQTDAHLWAQTYDRDLADVFAIQSEIARTIVDQLRAKLSPKEQEALDEKPTTDLVAYDLYLRATQIDRNRSSSIASGGAEETKREVGLLQEAIKHDPAFVPAICLLIQTNLYLYWLNIDSPMAHLEAARKGLEIVDRLAPNGGDVHLCRAIFHYWGSRDYSSALSELALARRSLPNDIRVLFFMAMIERRQGNWPDSIHRLEQALALDPCNLTMVSELTSSNFALQRYRAALKTVDTALAWKPDDFSLALLRAVTEMAWKADLQPWQAAISGDAAKNADANDLITARVDLALKQRNYAAAEQLLNAGGGTEFDDNAFFTPREWKQAIVARGLGNGAKANESFQVARKRVEKVVRTRPDDAKALMVLAQIDAALGHTQQAISAGNHAVELLPVAKDAVNGPQLLVRLASIYAQTGDPDRAFNLLEKEIRQPFGLNYGTLKLDEMWDPLRKDPRFDEMVALLAPKD